MERVVNKASSFAEADSWDQAQQKAMTPQQRMRIAKALRDRFFSCPRKDLREWQPKKNKLASGRPKDLQDLQYLDG